MLAACQLCVHFVLKGVGSSLSATGGLQCVWITPTQNEIFSDITMALQIFFRVPESQVNLPGLEQLQDKWGLLIFSYFNSNNIT